jgi:hypothetical protein
VLNLFGDHPGGARLAGDDTIAAADTTIQVNDGFTIDEGTGLQLTARDAGTAAGADTGIDHGVIVAGVHIGGAGGILDRAEQPTAIAAATADSLGVERVLRLEDKAGLAGPVKHWRAWSGPICKQVSRISE